MKVYVVTNTVKGLIGISGIECVRLAPETAQQYIDEAEKTNVAYVFEIQEFEAI